MCGSNKNKSDVSVPEFQLTEQEKQLQDAEVRAMLASIPGLTEHISTMLPLETARAQQIYSFTDPILKGEQLPGMYSSLGQGYGAGIEEEMFNRASDMTLEQMNELGILDSGMTAELLQNQADEIAFQSADRSREDMYNLMAIAMGVPTTGLSTASDAANRSSNTITSLGNAQRAYDLSRASLLAQLNSGSSGSSGFASTMNSIPWDSILKSTKSTGTTTTGTT